MLITTLVAWIIVGQQTAPMTKKDIPVTDRFENAIKAKEPAFKLVSKLVRNNQNEKYVLQGWQADREIVSATTYELASVEEAADTFGKYLKAPISGPVQTTKLTELGDEAFMSQSIYAKEGQSNLLFRKGKFLIVMSASSPDLAKRFAKHMANEIEN